MKSVEDDSSPTRAGAAGTGSRTTTANTGSWLLVVAFVVLVLSVAVPAMTGGTNGDVAAALLFMVGLTTTIVGTGLALVASRAKVRTMLGGLLMLVGLVLLYGLVPSLAALAVVLLGVAVEIGSLPAEGSD
ncbi:MAG TPA: hypothetical protein VLR26_00900 [Frankiaceae bacterium]|nr:hypothetical protein [Frankiaceae bacterium]